MKRIRISVSIIPVLVFGMVLTAVSQVQQPAITISSSKQTEKQGSPIQIHVVLSNKTQESFSLFKSVGGAHAELYYTVKVLAPDGKEATLTPYGRSVEQRQIMPISRIRKTVNPGESMGEDFDVSRIFEMSTPGKYQIQVGRPNPLKPSSDLKSNVLESV